MIENTASVWWIVAGDMCSLCGRSILSAFGLSDSERSTSLTGFRVKKHREHADALECKAPAMTKQPTPSRTMPSACIPPSAYGDVVRRELAVPSSTANRWHPEEAKVCQTWSQNLSREREGNHCHCSRRPNTAGAGAACAGAM